MLCERCKKNEATVHIKEFHGATCETHHLCSECAKKKDPDISLENFGFNLADVLFDVEKFAKTLQGNNSREEENVELKCPNCNWDAAKIKKSGGRLGCPECYNTFLDLIKSALNQVQRGSVHLGKRPADAAKNTPTLKKAELKKLQDELQKLVAAEEYEAAALCRDRINALKEQISAGNCTEDDK